jgi:hypothetical protein
MSEAATVGAEEEAKVLEEILREYAGKLTAMNADLLLFSEEGAAQRKPSRAAWLLDRFELVRKPLLQVLSRASQLTEHADLAPLTHDLMALRLAELETQLHHAARQASELQGLVRGSADDQKVARLRVAAGLSGMKGGPLRPE